MTIILGIDPGSIKTGFGIIKSEPCESQQLFHIAHGFIAPKGKTMGERLHQIYQELCELIDYYHPNESAIEEVFMQVNVQSALKLGQARGVALVALAQHGLSINEYSPRAIKKTATGFGAASKDQIRYMIQMQLQLPSLPQTDAADALAIAICHAQHRIYLKKMEIIL